MMNFRLPEAGISLREAQTIKIIHAAGRPLFVKAVWLRAQPSWKASWLAVYRLLQRMEGKGLVMRVQKKSQGDWGRYAYFMPSPEGLQKAALFFEILQKEYQNLAVTEAVGEAVTETVSKPVGE